MRMQNKTICALIAVLLIAWPTESGATILWRGLIRTGEAVEVSLHDSAKKTHAWVAVGGTFEGYRVEAFDKASVTLTLVHGISGERMNLRLEAAFIHVSQDEPFTREQALRLLAETLRSALARPGRPIRMEELPPDVRATLTSEAGDTSQVHHATKSAIDAREAQLQQKGFVDIAPAANLPQRAYFRPLEIASLPTPLARVLTQADLDSLLAEQIQLAAKSVKEASLPKTPESTQPKR